MGHHKGNIGAVIAAILAFVLVIVAWATYWYYVDTSTFLGKSHVEYYWTYVAESNKDSTTYPDNSKVKQIFSASLSFLTIGGAVLLGFIVALLLFMFACKKSGIFKFIVIGCGTAAVVLLCISFFTFLGITNAFKDDNDFGCALLGDNSPCKKFIGSYHSSSIDSSWGGGPGFWVCLGAIALTIGATISAMMASK